MKKKITNNQEIINILLTKMGQRTLSKLKILYSDKYQNIVKELGLEKDVDPPEKYISAHLEMLSDKHNIDPDYLALNWEEILKKTLDIISRKEKE